MTPEDEKFERIAQRHIADLKKSSKSIVEDATVRAVQKVMAEFAQGAHTEAKVEYHATMIQCPHCDGSVRVPAQPYPDNFIDALKYDVAKRDSEAQQQEPVALEAVYETIIHWDEGGGKRSRRELARRIVALYTSPPASKPWVGLSTDEIYDMYNEPRSDAEMVEFARAIEAKLREKNAPQQSKEDA